jgi:hypothetical protein
MTPARLTLDLPQACTLKSRTVVALKKEKKKEEMVVVKVVALL